MSINARLETFGNYTQNCYSQAGGTSPLQFSLEPTPPVANPGMNIIGCPVLFLVPPDQVPTYFKDASFNPDQMADLKKLQAWSVQFFQEQQPELVAVAESELALKTMPGLTNLRLMHHLWKMNDGGDASMKALLAHEVGHLALQHGAEFPSWRKTLEMAPWFRTMKAGLSALAPLAVLGGLYRWTGALLPAIGYGVLLNVAIMAGQVAYCVWQSPTWHRKELEADAFAFRHVQKAQVIEEALQTTGLAEIPLKIADLELRRIAIQGHGLLVFTGNLTHPSIDQRIAHIRQLAQAQSGSASSSQAAMT
jgi:hypothetical protein